jgi:hypothetical protein
MVRVVCRIPWTLSVRWKLDCIRVQPSNVVGASQGSLIPILFAGKYPLNSLKTIQFVGLLAFNPSH